MRRDPRLLVEIDPKLNRMLRKKALTDKRKLRSIVEMALIEFLSKDTIKDVTTPSATGALPDQVPA